jgi:toxin-antitoxin system PIN domain toxin
MLSVDTNILVYALDEESQHHTKARDFLAAHSDDTEMAICELVLVELYLHLRNPAVFRRPCTEVEAVSICQQFRSAPHWRLIENGEVMDGVWRFAAKPGFARRRIIDARLALTLRCHGVTEFATANTRDFDAFGFDRVWNPL